MVNWLELHYSTAEVEGSIPGRGAEILKSALLGQLKKKITVEKLCRNENYGRVGLCSETIVPVTWGWLKTTQGDFPAGTMNEFACQCRGDCGFNPWSGKIPHAKPVCHNYWACAPESRSQNHWVHVPRARSPQQQKSLQREACTLQLEKARVQEWRPSATRKK